MITPRFIILCLLVAAVAGLLVLTGHGPHADVEPTAGYYGDGSRFIRDIDTKRRELGIPDEMLIRSR